MLTDFAKNLFGGHRAERPQLPYSAALTCRRAELTARIAAIPWGEYLTAYGPATNVPPLLEQLLFGTEQSADEAVGHLLCALCHQDVEVDSAALPCFPFLVLAFEHAGEDLALFLLDLIHRLVTCEGGASDPDRDAWLPLLRKSFAAAVSTFESYAGHPNFQVRKYAGDIVREINALK
jgi:hypothetical protein